MGKFITIVDHLADYDKAYTHLENSGKDLKEAIANAAFWGARLPKVYCCLVGKKTRKANEYKILFRINGYDGSGEDTVKSNWNGWGDKFSTHTVFKSEIKPPKEVVK